MLEGGLLDDDSSDVEHFRVFAIDRTTFLSLVVFYQNYYIRPFNLKYREVDTRRRSLAACSAFSIPVEQEPSCSQAS
jgi:hypothetical protein